MMSGKDILELRLREWLHPPCFAEEFDESRSLKEDGTTGWLLKHETYLAWRTQGTSVSHSERRIWIKGW
jgi:hypothetical protein